MIGIVLAVIVSRRLAGQFDREREATRAANAAAWSRKELLDVVSHDLRSPLSSIVLGLDMLREEHPNTRYVSVISHSAERMQRLVNDLLDASRAEIAKLELDRSVVRPAELVAEIDEQFGDLAKSAGHRAPHVDAISRKRCSSIISGSCRSSRTSSATRSSSRSLAM